NGCSFVKLPIAARYSGSGGGELNDATLTDNDQDVVIVDGSGPQVTPAPAAAAPVAAAPVAAAAPAAASEE
ncbi:MAG: hypothetical protein ACI8RZ_004053, partial [Myxococcota bacterium]